MARYFARGVVRPAVLAAIVLLIAPAVILRVGHSLHASGTNTAVAVVSIETVGPSPILIVNEQASNGQDVPISMSVPLTAGCYDMTVEVFADALPSGRKRVVKLQRPAESVVLMATRVTLLGKLPA